MAVEISSAKGINLYGPDGNSYIDLISGVSVSNIGHCHPEIVRAIKEQADMYLHLMVYGEIIQSPQVHFSHELTQILPESLNSVYLVNSGSEAIEGALKLAKRVTHRTEIISYKNAYHGGTHGALSIMGGERWKQPFYPLLPDITQLNFNNFNEIERITTRTACVVIESIQAEAGVIKPFDGFLEKIRERCNDTGTLLIFDEIQTGFGRTGKMFAFEQFDVIPDILVLAKAMGGGMPAGAFVASRNLMSKLSSNPELGHITTFGGHPVCAAAALAHLKFLNSNPELIAQVEQKGRMFSNRLSKHPKVKEIRNKGLLMAVDVDIEDVQGILIRKMIENGIISDGFLFKPSCFRISPPLTITESEIEESCSRILKSLDAC